MTLGTWNVAGVPRGRAGLSTKRANQEEVNNDVAVGVSQLIEEYEKAASYQLRYDAALCFYVLTRL